MHLLHPVDHGRPRTGRGGLLLAYLLIADGTRTTTTGGGGGRGVDSGQPSGKPRQRRPSSSRRKRSGTSARPRTQATTGAGAAGGGAAGLAPSESQVCIPRSGTHDAWYHAARSLGAAVMVPPCWGHRPRVTRVDVRFSFVSPIDCLIDTRAGPGIRRRRRRGRRRVCGACLG